MTYTLSHGSMRPNAKYDPRPGEARENIPKSPTTQDDVLKAWDDMIKETYSWQAKYDMKAAKVIIDAMSKGDVTADNALGKLADIRSAYKVDILADEAKARKVANEKADRDQAYTMYDEMTRSVINGTISYDMKAAGKVLEDMNTEKITGAQAIQALAKI
jgi:hypothetical protein